MTPKMKIALVAIITEDAEYKIHGATMSALIHHRLVDKEGMATNEGVMQSGLPYDSVYLMILGADTYYGENELPKGTEVMVTWRERLPNQHREYVTGYIMSGGNLAAVCLYVSPRHTFETRVTPRLTESTVS